MKNWIKRTLGIEKLETQLQVMKEQSEVEHQRLLALKEEVVELRVAVAVLKAEVRGKNI